jgi:outer membrane protein OmpA-like peptidoglycan-associated protein
VDQVGEQTSQNTTQIQDTRTQVKQVDERAQSGISAATERASTADQHAGDAMKSAGDAMNRATTADQKADQNAQGLSGLRNVVANLDDYKLQTTATVPFPFNRYTLTADDKADLDKLADEVKADKRFLITIEGFTDNVGTRQYNMELSKKRAEAVENYLVAQHDIPLYRIHFIGLGEEKPVDEARTRAARAKNRRVEVRVFSADQVLSSLNAAPSGESSRTQENKQ